MNPSQKTLKQYRFQNLGWLEESFFYRDLHSTNSDLLERAGLYLWYLCPKQYFTNTNEQFLEVFNSYSKIVPQILTVPFISERKHQWRGMFLPTDFEFAAQLKSSAQQREFESYLSQDEKRDFFVRVVLPNLALLTPPIRVGITRKQTLRERLEDYRNKEKSITNLLSTTKEFTVDSCIVKVICPAAQSEEDNVLIEIMEKYLLNWQMPIGNQER